MNELPSQPVDQNDTGVHVYPTFGREHILSGDCWCCPSKSYVDLKNQNDRRYIWVHEPEN